MLYPILHQGTSLQYQSNSNQFYYSNKGAFFNAWDAVTNGHATASLKHYTVTETGNSKTVNGK